MKHYVGNVICTLCYRNTEVQN